MGCCKSKDAISNEKVFMLPGQDANFESYFTNDKTPCSAKGKNEEFARAFFRNSTQLISTPIKLKSSDKLIKKYAVNLENSKIKESITFREDCQKTPLSVVIEYPRLELHYTPESINDYLDPIIITPNSINGKVKNPGNRFYFGSRRIIAGAETNSNRENSENPSRDSSDGRSQNDYAFDDTNMGFRQFEISYNAEKLKYYILENKQGTGTFVKIKNKIVVNRDMIISFCSCHMVLQVIPDQKFPPNKIIKIKFLSGGRTTQEKVFSSKDKTSILVGRSKTAEVFCNNESVSRNQCTLIYKNDQWYLYDGYLDNGHRISTNGLWLLASCRLELKNDVVIKTGNTTMNVKLKKYENGYD